jgi:ribosomal protein S18 acetylase RimI-like enzyme
VPAALRGDENGIANDCPDLEDLRVSPGYRRRGFAHALLEAAEALAKAEGYRRIGLGVGVLNTAARSLYQKRGYAMVGTGEYRVAGSYVDADGVQRQWEEVCVYLVKDLCSATTDR